MKLFTFTGDGLLVGIMEGYGEVEKISGVNAGVRSKVRISQTEPPLRSSTNSWMLLEGSARKYGGEVIIEASEPNQKGILVYVKTCVGYPTQNGTWEFLPGREGKPLKKVTAKRTILTGHHEKDVLTWQEAIVILEPGHGLSLTDQLGRKRTLMVHEDGEPVQIVPD